MVDETQELPPVVEEPKTEAKEEPKRNVDDLLAELEKAGVESPQQLQGKLDASAQAGKAFQMLGDERKRNAELQAELDKLKVRPPEPNYDSYGEGQPIDIEAAMERTLERTLAKREQAMRQAQEASIQAYSAIKNDPNYHLVKEIWEEKEKNPAYIYQVQTGQVDPIRDFQGTVVEYFQKIAQESHKTIKELVGGKETPAPHVESGETHSPGATTNIVSEGEGESAHRQLLNRLRERVASGYVPTDEEEALIAEAVLMESPTV